METDTAVLLLTVALSDRCVAFDTGDEIQECAIASALADLLDTLLIDGQGGLLRTAHAERCENNCPLAGYARKLRIVS